MHFYLQCFPLANSKTEFNTWVKSEPKQLRRKIQNLQNLKSNNELD